jgi:hypothetical protein
MVYLKSLSKYCVTAFTFEVSLNTYVLTLTVFKTNTILTFSCTLIIFTESYTYAESGRRLNVSNTNCLYKCLDRNEAEKCYSFALTQKCHFIQECSFLFKLWQLWRNHSHLKDYYLLRCDSIKSGRHVLMYQSPFYCEQRQQVPPKCRYLPTYPPTRIHGITLENRYGEEMGYGRQYSVLGKG